MKGSLKLSDDDSPGRLRPDEFAAFIEQKIREQYPERAPAQRGRAAMKYQLVVVAENFEALHLALAQAGKAADLMVEGEVSISGLGAGWSYKLLRSPPAAGSSVELSSGDGPRVPFTRSPAGRLEEV